MEQKDTARIHLEACRDVRLVPVLKISRNMRLRVFLERLSKAGDVLAQGVRDLVLQKSTQGVAAYVVVNGSILPPRKGAFDGSSLQMTDDLVPISLINCLAAQRGSLFERDTDRSQSSLRRGPRRQAEAHGS